MKITSDGQIRINFRDFTPDIQKRLICNYNCSYCNQSQVKQVRFSEREFQQSKTIWDKLDLVEDDIHVRMNFDGEILIDPISRKIASYICHKENVVSFEIITNNSIDPMQYLDSFDTSKFSLNCSFHPEFTSIEKFLVNLNKLRDAGCPVFATMVVTPKLIGKLPQIAKRFSSEDILFRPLLLLGKYTPAFKSSFAARVHRYVKKTFFKGIVYPNAYKKAELEAIKPYYYSVEEFDYQYGKSTWKKPCLAGVEMINIFLNGSIMRCFISKLGYVDDLISGDVVLNREAYACPTRKCQCPTHVMFLKEFRAKYPLSYKFADLYLIDRALND